MPDGTLGGLRRKQRAEPALHRYNILLSKCHSGQNIYPRARHLCQVRVQFCLIYSYVTSATRPVHALTLFEMVTLAMIPALRHHGITLSGNTAAI